MIWPVKHHTADDLDARAQRDRIGRKPARLVHGAKHVFFDANESDVKCISRNSGAGACNHWQGGQAGFMLVMGPQDREQDVSQHEISDRNGR